MAGRIVVVTMAIARRLAARVRRHSPPRVGDVLVPARSVAERPRPLRASRRPRRGRRQRLLRSGRAGRLRALRRARAHRSLRQGRAPAPPQCRTRRAESSTTRSSGNNGAYDPAFLQSAYNAPSATNGVGPDRRDRRRVRRAERRERPRDVPIVVRAAAVHDGQRLLQEDRSEPAAPTTRRATRGWAAGDRARRADGERHLPELPHPAGRGDDELACRESRHRR